MFRVILLLVMLWPELLWGQAVINGTVEDAETGEPLIGASIQLLGTQIGTTTNEQGDFDLKLDQTKPIKLRVSYVGYLSKVVKLGQQQQIVIQLQPDLALEEVVIQAIRADDRVPVTQETIEKEALEEEYLGQDALFLLEELTPSITTYSESGTNLSNYGQMRLRGIDQTRINITLNGVPLNDMIDQGVFFSNFTDFGNSIESVQVQRGVGASTNGTASYAGSINFESVNLRDSVPSTEIQLSGGSFNTLRASGEVKTGVMDNDLSFYTRFTSTKADGYRYNTSTDSYSLFFSGGYVGEKDLIKITGFTGRSQNGLAYMPVALSDIEQDPRTNYVNQNDIDEFGQSLVQLQYTRWINDQSSLASSVYYGAAGGDFPAGFFTTDSIYSDSAPNNYLLNQRLMQINYPLFNDHLGLLSFYNFQSENNALDINAGLHLYTFQRKNLESVLPDDANPYYQESSHKNEASIFSKATYRLGKLSVYGDIQVRSLQLSIDPDPDFLPDQPDVEKNWTFINPKVGISYQLDHSKNFYLFYGLTGREPTKVDLLGGFQLNTFNIASLLADEVKPEYVNDLEMGIKVNEKSFAGQLNLFYMNFTNEIAPIGKYVPEGFIQLRKNVPNSYRRGIEMNWKWQIWTPLSFSGNATFMQSNIESYAPEEEAEIYKDVSQALTPEMLGNLSAKYIQGPIEIEISGRYMGESYLEPTNQEDLTLPSFWVADARLSVNLWQQHTFSLFLNNLFDQQYFTYGAPVDPDFDGNVEPGYFVQPPRNIYAILKLRF
ncbi:MAG: TonB-dependent receptor [Candidatus Cyclobacteriaceae bacterium M3_2C_046]